MSAQSPSLTNATLNKLRAAVLGANDGIVSTASVVMGVAGATSDAPAIFTAGMAALVAGALSMAVGEYVSVSSQRDAEIVSAKHDETHDGEFTSPWAAAIASFLAFSVGGLVPFIAVILAPDDTRIAVTVAAVLVGLVATGYFSAQVGKASKFRAVLRVVIGGLLAMAITYFIGTVFGTVVA
ncbi:MAG: VIT1/CCC1 transporter family protein [Candidatus Saccharimonadales bacterium]|nr:vacuolar iron transporter family protein [Patescibacteria group bacterium]